MSKILIIAEAGVNHNGSIKIAKSLIYYAKKAGADAIKFQLFDTSSMVTKYSTLLYKKSPTSGITMKISITLDLSYFTLTKQTA